MFLFSYRLTLVLSIILRPSSFGMESKTWKLTSSRYTWHDGNMSANSTTHVHCSHHFAQRLGGVLLRLFLDLDNFFHCSIGHRFRLRLTITLCLPFRLFTLVCHYEQCGVGSASLHKKHRNTKSFTAALQTQENLVLFVKMRLTPSKIKSKIFKTTNQETFRIVCVLLHPIGSEDFLYRLSCISVKDSRHVWAAIS